MRKYILCLVAVVILSASFYFLRAESVIAPERAILAKAMEAAGAPVKEFSINGWGKLPDSVLSEEDLAAVTRNVMARLGVKPEEYTLNHSKSQSHRMVRADAVRDNFHAVAIAQVLYPVWEKKGPETYLVVNVEMKGSSDQVPAWQSSVRNVINDAGGAPRISTCLVGWLDGKLEEGQHRTRLEKAFETLNAIPSGQYKGKNLESLSGYTAAIPDYVQVGDQRVNVNIAIRYSPYDDRTYVVVGSPVISKEY